MGQPPRSSPRDRATTDLLAEAERRLAEIRARFAAGRATDADVAAATELARSLDALRARAERPAAAPPSERPAILLAVADVARRDAIATWLDGAGFRLVATGSAATARALAREEPDAFALLVGDVELEDGSGIGVAAEARRLRPELPVVLMAAAPPDSIVSRLPWDEARGDTLVVERAVSPQRLVAVVRELTRRAAR
jgi:CheY-like chemotaxis protein